MATGYPGLRILVVDNGSADGTVDVLREALPGIEVVGTNANLGYAGGNNFGIRHVEVWNPAYVLIINNDVEVEPLFLQSLISALETDSQAAMATCTVCYDPERDIIQYAGGDLIPWRGSGFTRGQGKQFDTLRAAPAERVSFVSGCIMLVRMEDFRRFGAFDERFFLYCEDAELCFRFVQAGRALLYVPSARIFHKMGHRSTRPGPYYFMYRNRMLFADLLPSRVLRLVAKGYVLGTAFAKMVVWRFQRPDLYTAVRMGIEDFAHGRFYEGRAAELGRILSSERGRGQNQDK
jgi:GT2 family glycosyltransferase